MTVELKGTTYNCDIGKLPKFTAKLTGEYKGIEISITLKAESEEDITNFIPIYARDLKVQFIEPSAKLDDFQPRDLVILEEFILGVPVEESFVAGKCSECGADMWVSPSSEEIHICVACKRESAAEKRRREQKEWIKQKRMNALSEKQNDTFVFKLPDETWDEFEERKRLIEEEQFRAERATRAEAQA